MSQERKLRSWVGLKQVKSAGIHGMQITKKKISLEVNRLNVGYPCK